MPRPEGVIVSSVTPFTKSGDRVDTTWLSSHLAYLQQGGVKGVVVLGSLSEGASMTLDEMKQVVDLTLLLRQDLSVIVGTANAEQDDAIDLAGYAMTKGVDAILILLPPARDGQKALPYFDYAVAILESLPATAQVVLLSDPREAGGQLTDDVLDNLFERFADRIIGIKDNGMDKERLRELVARYPEVTLYTGRDGMLIEGLLAGAGGAFSGAANIVPEGVVQVYEDFQVGDDLSIPQMVLPLLEEALEAQGHVAAIKGLIPLYGDPGMTYPRSPLELPSLGALKKLEDRLIEAFGLSGLFHS